MASQHSFGRSVSTVTDVARGSTGGPKNQPCFFGFLALMNIDGGWDHSACGAI